MRSLDLEGDMTADAGAERTHCGKKANDEPAQKPDYVAACEFLRFVSSFPVMIFTAAVAGSIGVGLLAALAVEAGWHFAARTMERRRGEAGRSLDAIAWAIFQSWPPTMAVLFAAYGKTTSLLPTLLLVVLIRIAIDAVGSALLKIDLAMRNRLHQLPD